MKAKILVYFLITTTLAGLIGCGQYDQQSHPPLRFRSDESAAYKLLEEIQAQAYKETTRGVRRLNLDVSSEKIDELFKNLAKIPTNLSKSERDKLYYTDSAQIN